MSIYNFLKKPALCLALVFSFHPAIADNDQLINCPSVDELKTFNFDSAIPYRFDKATKSMKFVTFANKTLNETADLVLVLYPVIVGPGEQPEKNMRELTEKLQLESATPLTYRLADDLTVPMCAYSLPQDNNVNALLIYDNGDLIDESDVALDAKNKHQRSMKLIKQLVFN